jgi:hypothetical protein
MNARSLGALLIGAVLGLGGPVRAGDKSPDLPLKRDVTVQPAQVAGEDACPLLPAWPVVPAGTRVNDAGIVVPDVQAPVATRLGHPLPVLELMPLHLRKNLTGWVLFGAHPLLWLCPTDELLDCPCDHPQGEAAPACPKCPAGGMPAMFLPEDVIRAILAAWCGSPVVEDFGPPCEEDCCQEPKPDCCKCEGKCTCKECCCKKGTCAKSCTCAKGCCGKDCCAKGCCAKGCCETPGSGEFHFIIPMGWLGLDVILNRNADDDQEHGSFGLTVPCCASALSVWGYFTCEASQQPKCGCKKAKPCAQPAPDTEVPPSCPWMGPQKQSRQIIVSPEELEEHSVMKNLQKLIEAREVLQRAEELRQAGHLCDSLDCYQRVRNLCPGSTAAEVAEAAIAQVKAELKTSAPSATGASEEQEPAARAKRRKSHKHPASKAKQAMPPGCSWLKPQGFGLTPCLPTIHRDVIGLERIGIDFEKRYSAGPGLMIVIEEEHKPQVNKGGEEAEEAEEEEEFIPWYDEYDQSPETSGTVRDLAQEWERLLTGWFEMQSSPTAGLRLHSRGCFGPVVWELRRDGGCWSMLVQQR